MHDPAASASMSTRSLRVRYLMGLGMIVGLAVIAGILLHQENVKYSEHPATINMAGRQRMLSQRLAKNAFRLAPDSIETNADSMRDARREFIESMKLWRSSHESLNRAVRSTPAEDELSHQLRQQYEELTPVFNQFDVSARALILSRPDDLASRHAAVQSIAKAEREFLGRMDKIVGLHQQIAHHDQVSVGNQLILLAILTLIVAVFEVLFVFEPAIRRVGSSLSNARDATLVAQRLQEDEKELRRDAEEKATALKESEKIVELAMRAANEGFWDWNIETGETFFSDTFYTMLGYEPRELPMHVSTWESLCEPDELARAYAEIKRHLDGETEVYQCEHRVRTKSGEQKWILDVGHVIERDADGKPTRMVGVHIDIHAAKVTEKALREAMVQAEVTQRELSQQRLEVQSILDAIPAFVYYKDDENTILRANRAAAETIGVTVDDIRGRKTEEFFPADDAKKYLQDDQEVIHSETPKLNIVEPYETGDGERRIIRTDKVPLRGPSGQYDRLVAIASDITDQVKNEQRLKLAIDSADAGIWDWNIPANTLVSNEQYMRMLGEEPMTEPVGVEWFMERLHGSDVEQTWWAVESSHSEGDHPFHVTFRLRCKDGSYRWIQSTGRVVERDADGRPIRMIGQHIDIDDRVQIERALRESEERFERCVGGSSDGLWDYDPRNGHVWFARRFAELLGYDVIDLEPHIDTWSGLLHPDDREIVISRLKSHLEYRKPFDVEHRMRCKDGSYRWFRARGLAIWGATGEAERMGGSISDIHALKRTQQELLDAMHDLESATRAKSEFLANMSHEIRTPMTAILGYADLLDTTDAQVQSDVQRLESIRTIRRNGEHLLSIINDILDVSKIEAGKMDVESISASPVQIIDDVVSLMSVRAEGKGIELRTELSSPVPASIRTDPVRFRQILTNIIGNAVKFTEVGSVTVRVGCDRDAQQLKVDVIDTGIGMNDEQLARVFEAFVQADTSTTRNFGGTGLGLQISRRLSEMLGGSLTVTSASEAGSTFTVTIATGALDDVVWVQDEDDARDLIAELNRSAASRDRQLMQSLGTVRILLAEDGPDNQRLISFHLQRAGAQVHVVENGEDALRAIDEAEHAFDVVLMDMQMPVLDGYDATRELRARGSMLPVIALTAHAMTGDRARCLDAGCSDYLSKPIDAGVLIATCANWAMQGRQDAA
ncbi:MAG: PAS domain-containing protein [Planctomycetota bacterium]